MKILKGVITYVGIGDINETASVEKEFIECSLEGIVGDRHFGFTKKADVRDKPIPKYLNGERHLVRNWRQWSAVSEEELAEVAKDMGITNIKPEWLGANFCVKGISEFTKIPKGSTLWFPDGTILTVEDENEPCIYPAKEISKNIRDQDFQEKDFVIHAQHKRGLVGVVYQPGKISNGDQFELHFYEKT